MGTDEKVLAVFAFDQLDLAGTFVLGSSDGYIKQTALSDLQPQRTYKRKPMMAMKLKTPGAVVTNAYFTTDQAQDVFVVSRHAYGLDFPLDEVSTVGARATGVKSMDLKPEDEVVNFILVKQPEKAVVGILTQRGAFKRMALSEVGQMSRARRGLLVLRELKRDPHRIVAMMQVDDNTRLDVLTDADKVITLTPVNHPTGDRYSNGSFVIDTDVQGKPVFVRTREETPVEP